jgi:hypothetical protein
MVRSPKTIEDRVPDIFDEVAEDLRAERAHALFRRYGIVVLCAAVLAVAATGGWEVWRWQEARTTAAAANAYLAATQPIDGAATIAQVNNAKRLDAARALAAVAKDAPEGYRTLADLRQAALLFAAGNAADANALWDKVAKDSSADPLLRDLANLLWVEHQPAGADDSAARARLQPLTTSSNPWHSLALEQFALLDLQKGAVDQARDTLRQLAADGTAPEGVRGRASGLLMKLGG